MQSAPAGMGVVGKSGNKKTINVFVKPTVNLSPALDFRSRIANTDESAKSDIKHLQSIEIQAAQASAFVAAAAVDGDFALVKDDVIRRRLAEHLVNLSCRGMSEGQIAARVELLLKERAPKDKVT